MAPRSRQKNTAQEPPPAPEDPALGMRTRQAGRSAGAEPPTYLSHPPLHALLAREIKHVVLADSPATRLGDPRALLSFQLLTQPKPPPEQGQLLRRSFHKPQHVVLSSSPRPIHASSDVEDSDGDGSDDFPVVPHQRPLRAPALLSAADSDEENPPPRRAAAHKKASGRRRGRGATAAPTPAETAGDNEAGSAYVFIDPETLVKTKKSADSDYFFGRRAIDKGFKCRLCPQEYGSGSSLTTRRLHLQNTEGHMEVYLAAVQRYGFTNKLPEFLQHQAMNNVR
ncbi:hypothetical protein B0H13DRAFT_2303349 [Mycena leptocephala]|nr:hypothetical protein B0H13DRAFT_2303349 [Mycena leptocephala]